MNKVIGLCIVVAVVVLFGACAKRERALSKGQIKDMWAQVSDQEFIRVRGIGSAPEGIESDTQRRGLAREAALVNGRREALALLRGVKLTGGVTIQKLMERDSNVREIANAIILGMEEVQTEWSTDGGCVVLLELRRDKLTKMLADAGVADLSESYKQLESGSQALDARPELAKIRTEKAQ